MTRLRRVGFFREMRHGDAAGPSLHEARRAVASPDDVHIVNYLNSGKIYVATPGPSVDVLDERRPRIAPPHVMTDGVYCWPGDLSYYVQKYHVRLADDFVAHMEANGWAVPDVDVLALHKAETK